ncbi:type II toxin-antitoxin system VapC family toxin [Phormidesmis priestleyi]
MEPVRWLFHQALDLYKQRADKAWSHPDCASFCIMKQQNILEALTHDRHFEQAGFIALLQWLKLRLLTLTIQTPNTGLRPLHPKLRLPISKLRPLNMKLRDQNPKL